MNAPVSRKIDMAILGGDEHRALRRKLSSILKEPSDVEDVLQDAYLRLMEVNRGDQQIENPPGFLHRVCVNLALDRVRLLSRRDRLFVSDSCEEVEMRMDCQPCCGPTPEEQCLIDDLSRNVMTVLDQLPEKCRQAFLMSRYWEYNYKEIADDMGLSVSMIEKYLLRASRHVRTELPEAVAA